MRKTNRLAVTLMLGFAALVVREARAELATEEEMERVCQNWLAYMVFQQGSWAGEVKPEIVDVREIVSGSGDVVMGHCFSIAPQGYVVVPILMELPPVKACSEEYDLDVDQTLGFAMLLREILEDRLNRYIKMYGDLDASQPPGGDVLYDRANRQEWDRFLAPSGEFGADLKTGGPPTRGGVGPLLTTAWHQRDPYNNFCPMGDGGRCLVGCVATAAAQVMRYHAWPPSGTGSHSYSWDGDDSCGGNVGGGTLSADFSDAYDWANMPDSCAGGCTQAQQDALAELCYEVGVAYEMDYGACSSRSSTYRALSVLPTYFGYDAAIDLEERDDHTAATWFNLIASEIDVARPILYRIYGHAIVCDGWRVEGSQNQVHMNYGWADSHTTWYTVDNLHCPWPGCHPMQEYLVRRIMPVGSGDIICYPVLEELECNVCQRYYYTVTITHPDGSPVNQQPIFWYVAGGEVESGDDRTGPDGYASMHFRVCDLDRRIVTVTVTVNGFSRCSSTHPVWPCYDPPPCPAGRTIGVGGACMDIDPSGAKAAFGQGKNVRLLDLVSEQSCSRNLLDIIYGDINAVAFKGDGTLIGLSIAYRQRGIQPASCPLSGGCFPVTPSGEGLGDSRAGVWIGDRLLLGHDPTTSKIYQFSLYNTSCALLHKIRVTDHHVEDISDLVARSGSSEWAAVSDGPECSQHNWVYYGSVSGNVINVYNYFLSPFDNGGVCWSADGSRLVVGSDGGGANPDRVLAVYNRSDLGGGTPTPVVVPLDHGAHYIAFSNDGAYAAVSQEGSTRVSILDTTSGNPSGWMEHCTLHFDQGCTGLEWLPNTHILIAASTNQIQFAYLDDTTDPDVVISSPPNGYSTWDECITVTGHVSDASGIQYAQIRVNDDNWINLDLDGGGNFSQEVCLELGENTIEVRAFDNAGREGSDGITVTRLVDVTPPAILDPGASPEGVLRPGVEVTICAGVVDDLSGVDDDSVAADVQRPDENNLETIDLHPIGGDEYCGTWDTTGYTGGVYLVDIYACDMASPPNCGEAENAIEVELNEAPVVEITAPIIDEIVFVGDTYTLRWNPWDPDSDALTSLYLDSDQLPPGEEIPVLNGSELPEDTTTLELQAGDYEVGTYYVYARICDEYGCTDAWSSGTLRIARDCNGNGVPDADDIANGTSEDCNGNGVPDECDIASGTSEDCQPNGVPDECELGDLNCDGVVDAFDIDPFVLALVDRAAYEAQFPDCSYLNGDVDCDGDVDSFDIDPFVELLTGG